METADANASSPFYMTVLPKTPERSPQRMFGSFFTDPSGPSRSRTSLLQDTPEWRKPPSGCGVGGGGCFHTVASSRYDEDHDMDVDADVATAATRTRDRMFGVLETPTRDRRPTSSSSSSFFPPTLLLSTPSMTLGGPRGKETGEIGQGHAKNEYCFVANLPVDIIATCILPILDPITLLRISLTSRRLYEIGSAEMERRCAREGIHHPQGNRAWEIGRSPSRTRKRMSPYAKRVRRKPPSPSPSSSRGGGPESWRSPLSGPVIGANRFLPIPATSSSSAANAALGTGMSFKEKLQSSGIVLPVTKNPAKTLSTADRHSRFGKSSSTSSIPSSSSSARISSLSARLASPRKRQWHSPARDWLPEELAVQYKKEDYYRRKFFEKILDPLCCLCYGRNGGGRPHPFFADRHVCKECFYNTVFELEFLHEPSASQFRFSESVTFINVTNKRFPPSHYYDTRERERTIGVYIRTAVYRSIRAKYASYQRAFGRMLRYEEKKKRSETEAAIALAVAATENGADANAISCSLLGNQDAESPSGEKTRGGTPEDSDVCMEPEISESNPDPWTRGRISASTSTSSLSSSSSSSTACSGPSESKSDEAIVARTSEEREIKSNKLSELIAEADPEGERDEEEEELDDEDRIDGSPSKLAEKIQRDVRRTMDDLYMFYFVQIYPLTKRGRGDELLLEQTVPLLQNANLWRLPST